MLKKIQTTQISKSNKRGKLMTTSKLGKLSVIAAL